MGKQRGRGREQRAGDRSRRAAGDEERLSFFCTCLHDELLALEDQIRKNRNHNSQYTE
jgi:hypothetical protein